MCPENFFYPPAEMQIYAGMFPVSPYWDEKIVSLALSIPIRLKVKFGKSKYILRQAAAFENDKNYWMLPKIGLQNSYRFVMNSSLGKEWKDERIKKIIKSEEYEMLKQIMLGTQINTNRLLTLNLWKEKNLL
jgi:asparagine synthetase B (glutamine-hydrolysing)